ncbi:MAG: SDR family oxidoreductase [Planctomycetes bacterium]|nr:SDR family oxidoreductase [Planctomycetota bacterium]
MTRTVLVTGAGRGVGRACAIRFAQEGARVACAARSQKEIEAVAAECMKAGATDARAFVMDVTSYSSISSALTQIRKAYTSIDVLCHSAGGAKTAPFGGTDEQLWNEMIALNLTSAYLVGRAVLGDMLQKRKGRMIFIGSTASRSGYRYCAAYTASKHGLLGMVRSLALEVAAAGVTANVVAPGYIRVSATEQAAKQVASRVGKTPEQVLAVYRAASPQGRMFEPDEVAALVQFVASDSASGINGQCLLLDGGAVVA